jgi:Tol biopolymer transport system component
LKKYLAPALLILFQLLTTTQAFAKFDPAFTWTTLETSHFLIHFHQGEDELAARAAVLAEDIHARLAPVVRWEPKERTHIVLVDAEDDANGMATVFPYNLIVLFPTPPAGDPGFGTTAYDDWMRMLITHEYTHILQMDMITGGLGSVMQPIFGRLYFPNAHQPIWLIEGLAVYEETEQTSGGRGRSPGADMVLRMAALDGPFPTLDQAAVFPDFWPSGQVPYLFGESFLRFIGKKYGKEKIADISAAYSSRWFPFLVGSTGKNVLGDSYPYLWNEWRMSLTDKYRSQEQRIREKGITVSQPLTQKGYRSLSPAYSPDGRLLAYAVENADEFPAIYLMNADGSGDRKLVNNVSVATGIAWSADGSRIYYTKTDVQRNVNLYNDIYAYELAAHRELRITCGLRARDPFPSADGKSLLFVASALGKTRLGVLTLPASDAPVRADTVQWLTEWSSNQYSSPRYNADGSQIAVSVLTNDARQDIWLLDSNGAKVTEVTHDSAVDINAALSTDNKYLYFSSDRDGVFNLYAYELATKNIFRVTNVVGGAFTPAPSADGKTLAYSSYSGKGFDVHRMQIDAASWRPADAYQERYLPVSYAEKPVETQTRAYNPLPTLLPQFWLPWYGYSEASRDLWGFLTYGQDAVEHHTYLAEGLYSPMTHRTWYSVNYAYDGLYPTILLSAWEKDSAYETHSTHQKVYEETTRTIDISVVTPLLQIERQHALALGYRREDISKNRWPGYTGSISPDGMVASVRAVYEFNNSKHYGFSISPEDGRSVAVGAEHFDRSLGSDFDGSKYTFDWHEYVSLPTPHQVLQARAFIGASSGDRLPLNAYQMGGDDPGDTLILINDDFIYLRGYPVNAFVGRNAGLASLEYRFPIKDIEHGADTGPFFSRRLHAAFFAEAGDAWNDGFSMADVKHAVGAELRLDTDVAYRLPITFRVVVAVGLDRGGEKEVYLTLWMPSIF